ncbi:MAG: type II toxin-antitoxin system VapC family toxin [Parvularculaceae bacterium]
MLIIDTSALAAILLGEAAADSLAACMASADARALSAANYLELGIVMAGKDAVSARTAAKAVDRFLAASDVAVTPVSEAHARTALEAHLKFGKGRGHRARLNFGDCFAYALAKALGAPLLFVGEDFAHTDIQSAL